jgi:hypothetical protein
MDYIYDSLKDLASVLTAGQFLMILAIITLVSGLAITFFIRNYKNPNGIFAFLKSNNEEMDDDIAVIKEQIEFLSTKMDNIIREVKEIVGDAFIEQRDIGNSIKTEITRTVELKEEIQEMYSRLNNSLEDVKTVIRLQDSHEQQSAEHIKNILQQSLDAIRSTQAHLEKLDDYIRDQVPQFRADNKEFAKDLNDLSRDLALIERSIQTQVSTIQAVTLRQ